MSANSAPCRMLPHALIASSAWLLPVTSALADFSSKSSFLPADVGLRADIKVGPGEPANDMLAGTLGLGYGLRLEERFADWTIMDRETGETASIGDYFVYGAFFGARLTFD